MIYVIQLYKGDNKLGIIELEGTMKTVKQLALEQYPEADRAAIIGVYPTTC
ncbi:MAG: hypothetical protein PHX80_03660 [Candidatus Nanoarchaeia archaeon]|nr:hypothetical protein [Candidatus Nanoarchaeia archaeon]